MVARYVLCNRFHLEELLVQRVAMPKTVWSDHEVVLIAINLTQEYRKGGEFSAVERILTRRLLGRCNFQLRRKVGRPVTE